MDSAATTRKLPKLKTQKTWKETNQYLCFDREKMWCSVCAEYEDKIRSCKNFNMTFITGSTNFQHSAVKAHTISAMHEKAVLLRDEEKAKEKGEEFIKKLTPSAPTPIGESLKNINKLLDKDRDYLKRLFEVSYLIAIKGRPYSDFEDILSLEKLHGVKFSPSEAYEHNNACKTFIEFSSKCIFEKSTKEKITRAHFVSVLCDGSTDSAVVEKECVYVIYVDVDIFTPVCSFLSLQDPESQDAIGIKDAITKLEALNHMTFLTADGAFVNSGGTIS